MAGVMMQKCTQSHRRLTLGVACLVLAINTLTTLYFQRLGDDPLKVLHYFTLYACFASVLSVFGLVGALRNDATLVAIFANFLLLDVLLSVIPRVLGITLIPTLEGSICSADSITAFLQAQPALKDANSNILLADIQTECHRVLDVIQCLVASAAIGVTFVQGWLALHVHKYAQLLRLEELDRQRPAIDRWAALDSKLREDLSWAEKGRIRLDN